MTSLRSTTPCARFQPRNRLAQRSPRYEQWQTAFVNANVRDGTVKLKQNENLVEFTAATAGANPLVPKSPDIDTEMPCRFDFKSPREIRLLVGAFGDTFPNLEVFIICYRSE